MAYYKYSSVNGDLIEISDFQLVPDAEYVVSANDVNKSDLLTFYVWDSYSLSFQSKVHNTVSKREFLKRFTPDEYGAIKTATSTNSTLDYYWQILMSSESINLDETDAIETLNIMETSGIVSSSRKLEILA